MTIQAGTYKIVNVKGGTALDLSGGDGKSIIGFTVHGQGNQQWEISNPQDNGTVSIKSVASGKYLNVEGQPGNGVKVVAVDVPGWWFITKDEHNPQAWRVFYPSTDFNFDLEDHGNPTPGTPVQLWEKTPGKGQTWHFESL